MFVTNKMMDRQQFDGCDAELLQVIDGGRCCKPRIRAAQFLRDVRVPGGKSVYMQFIDHGPIPRRSQELVSAPREGLVDDHTFGYRRGVIPVVERKIGFWVADAITEQR